MQNAHVADYYRFEAQRLTCEAVRLAPAVRVALYSDADYLASLARSEQSHQQYLNRTTPP